MAVLGNEDHKQRVNLSSLARSVIEIDQSVFDEGGTLSGFLNRIITAFREKADASIEFAAQERYHQLLSSGYMPEIAQQLAAEYKKHLTLKKEAYPQGDSVIFRLNNHNFRTLYEEHAESSSYNAPSKYLKALLEEYARLSPSERERIYYAQLIDDILQPAIDAGHLLELFASGKRFWVKPYNIMADPFNSHMYLVGLAQCIDKPTDQESIASFRITRLANVKLRRQPSGRLTAEDRHQIERKLQQVGVQYLVGIQDNIKIQLSKNGQREFLQRSYMRPTPVKIEGNIYYFCCSAMQIRNYFLPFGKEAQILEPVSLRKEFLKIYRNAVRAYEQPPV